MKKAESVKEFVERIDASKKVNPKDLSSDQDLTIAIMPPAVDSFCSRAIISALCCRLSCSTACMRLSL